MMSKKDVLEWLETLDDESGVAIDDGGLTLVEIDENGEETGATLEIGGIPDEDELIDPEEDEEEVEDEFAGFQTDD